MSPMGGDASAQPQAVSRPAVAAADDKLNWRIVAPVLVVAVLAVAAVLGFALLRDGGKSSLVSGGQLVNPSGAGKVAAVSSTVTINFEGREIESLTRPVLTAFASEVANSGDNAQPASLTAAVPHLDVDSDLGNVLYADDASDGVRELLVENGFAVIEGLGGDEFFERYERNRYNKIPSFVTSDSIMHTYHLFFSHLLKNTEREHLATDLADMSAKMLIASIDQLDTLKGTEWQSAAERNVGFFAVGAALSGVDTQAPANVADAVKREITLVQAAEGQQASPLLGVNVDYSQFAVRGYYEGDDQLEPYFRAMMWYGQVNFLQEDKELGDDLDRSALLATLALDGGAIEQWERIYAVTSFFAGSSDDCGYYEYKPLIEAAYGEGASVDNLAGNEKGWKAYHAMTAQMSAPRINSVAGNSDAEGGAGNDGSGNAEDKGFRFMGQRFSIDSAIFQHLIADDVGANAQGAARMLPNALDVPAAFGSDEALSILDEEGETDFAGYDENMAQLRQEVSGTTDGQWNASLYSRWLNTLMPLLEKKGEGWPAFMQSQEWARKNLQSFLGSYAELKHDTVLYSKQAMAEAGGMIEDKDDRGYVEPEAELYRRLSQLAQATSSGLASFGMLSAADAENVSNLQELAEKLEAISKKELANKALSDDEYELIRSYGAQLEHLWEASHQGDSDMSKFTHWDFPAAVVSDVATGDGAVLELGTGCPSVIYAIVPIDGKLRVASGTVFSFYQFEWPASNRLTDAEWREMMGFVSTMGSSSSTRNDIEQDSWTDSFTVRR